MTKNDLILRIRDKASAMRRDCIEMGYAAGSEGAHFGPALSSVDIVASLFFGVMNHDPQNPQMPERDRFVLSKGHACLSYYSALVESGYVPRDMICTFKGNNSILCGHPRRNVEYGIEVSSGSLGNGFSLACGIAKAAKVKKENWKVYCVIGDGECNEGIIWEAAMNAAKNKLDNIIAIVDLNGFQLSGKTDEVMDLDLVSIWTAFGWDVKYIDDGNDVEKVLAALEAVKDSDNGRPHVIIASTIKGKGISYMENNLAFHAAPLKKDQYDLAIRELESAGKGEQ